jgi:hypothetical protein
VTSRRIPTACTLGEDSHLTHSAMQAFIRVQRELFAGVRWSLPLRNVSIHLNLILRHLLVLFFDVSRDASTYEATWLIFETAHAFAALAPKVRLGQPNTIFRRPVQRLF